MILSLVFTQNCGEQDATHPGIELTHEKYPLVHLKELRIA